MGIGAHYAGAASIAAITLLECKTLEITFHSGMTFCEVKIYKGILFLYRIWRSLNTGLFFFFCSQSFCVEFPVEQVASMEDFPWLPV